MSGLRKHLLGSTILGLTAFGLAGGACVDPDGEFKKFDQRVFDAGPPAVGTGCTGGEIPDVSGDFFLNLSTPLSRDAYLQFIFTQSIDKTINPAVLSMSLQPLCTQEDQCTVGDPIGDMITLDKADVDENCDFSLDIIGVEIPGGANSISGSDLVGNLEMQGNLQSADFMCGIVDGEAIVAGPVPIDGSTFGSVRIPDGGALPDPVAICPEVP
jgi:hypothetical protein